MKLIINYYYWVPLNNEGVWSIISSLIVIVNKGNDTYTITDVGSHTLSRKKILNWYISFLIKELNNEPPIIDNGEIKFVWIKQNYSWTYKISTGIKNQLKECNFNLTNFYGK